MTDAAKAHTESLISMGFGRELAVTAVQQTGGASLSAALDWLTASRPAMPRRDSSVAEAEHWLISAAINESLKEDTSAAAGIGPGTPFATLSEDEQLQLILEASAKEEEDRRRISIAEVEDAMASMATTSSIYVPPEPEPECDSPPPNPPAIFYDEPAKAVVRRRLTRRAPDAITIAKAAVVLRRRAAAARKRAVLVAGPVDDVAIATARIRASMSDPSTVRDSQVEDPFPSTARSSALPVPDVADLPAAEAGIVLGKHLLSQRLTALRLESVSVRDDGACQFRAFSQQLYGTEDYHRAVRESVVSHMEREEAFFGAMFGEGELRSYLEAMRHSRTWGDE